MNSKQIMSSSSSSSTLPLPFLTMILTFLFLTNIVSANTQSCSEKFTTLIEQRNMTGCKKLSTLEAEFGWSYKKNTNSTTVEILFGANIKSSEGWIAWGVNPGKRAEMIGTRALIGIKHSTAALNVSTYNVTKETKSGCSLLPTKKFDDDDLQVWNMSMKDEGSNFYTIYAKLILPSNKYNISKLNHVWQVGSAAIGDKPLPHTTNLHNVDSTEAIDLTSSSGRSTGQYRSYLRTVHGVLNIIGWGILLPIGVIIARYFRVFPFKCETWFYFHIGTQLSGFLIGTAGWIIGLSLGHSSTYYTFHTHRTFGIIIFTFSTVQMLAFRLKPKVTDDYRKYWNMYHHFLGYGLLAIIIINIFKGITILHGGVGWRWSYIGILIFLGVIAFGLEILTWIWFIKLKLQAQAKKASNQKG